MAKQWMAILLTLLMLLSGCSQPTATGKTKPASSKPVSVPAKQPDKISEKTPLIAEAETLEEAEALAELYGITLVEFNLGLASFTTEEDPKDVIRRGQENNWPELTLNRLSQLY